MPTRGIWARIGFFLGAVLTLAVAGALSGSPARATHIPGATYTGTHSGGGTVQLTLSADGSAVTSYALTNIPAAPTCYFPTWSATGSFPITNHQFDHSFTNPENSGAYFRGSFAGTQAASGTVKAVQHSPFHCEAAVYTWTATTTATPPPVPPPVPPPPAPPPAQCVVPKLKGRTLPGARAALRRSRCRLGAVTRRYSRAVRKGRVMAQRPLPRTRRANGARVNVTVSRGRRG